MPEFWPFRPNKIAQRLAFNTKISSSFTEEWRRSNKSATQILTYSYVLPDQRAENMELRNRKQPSGFWDVPVWPEASFIKSIIPVGTSITVDTNAGYIAGGRACVVLNDFEWEIVDISAVLPGQINLISPLTRSYDGTLANAVAVAPVGSCFHGGLNFSRASTATQASVEFTRADMPDMPASTYAVYLGSPVIDDGARKLSGLSGRGFQKRVVLENGFGNFALEDVEGYSREEFQLAFADVSMADRWKRIRFIQFTRGKDAAFWVPTHKADIVPIIDMQSTETLMTIKNTLLDPVNLTGRHIFIQAAGGAPITRQITNAVVSSGVTQIAIAAPGRTVLAGDRISLMNLCRFDSDEIDVSYTQTVGDYVARIDAPIVEVSA